MNFSLAELKNLKRPCTCHHPFPSPFVTVIVLIAVFHVSLSESSISTASGGGSTIESIIFSSDLDSHHQSTDGAILMEIPGLVCFS
jgi:hypothetical protein